MTTQDIALIRELLYRAKDLDLIRGILEFANEISKLKLEETEENSKKLKNIDESIISKCESLKEQLRLIYLPKLLNDLPDELSESQEVDVLQSIMDMKHYLWMDEEGNVFKQRPHAINMEETLDKIFEYSKKLKDSYEDATIMLPKYDGIEIYDNIIVVRKYDKYGVLDKNGNKIIPIKLTKIYSIRDTKNFIVKRDGKAGIIDDNGKFILDIEFDDIIKSYFSYDKYVMALVKGDSVTFVDKNLNEIKEHNFYIDREVIYEKYSYQDENSNQVVLDDLYIYKQKGNLYIVKERSKYNEIVMNNKGEILKNIDRGEVEFFGENFYIQKDNNLSIFNDKGEILKSLRCDHCYLRCDSDLENEILEISLGFKHGIVMPNLNALEAIYDKLDYVENFGLSAELGKKRYLINNNLEIISEHDFDSIRLMWWDNVLLAGDSSHHPFRGKCYLLDFNGKILPQSYYFEIPKDYLKG